MSIPPTTEESQQGVLTSQRQATRARLARFEDIRWLMADRTDPDEIARRIGVKRSSLTRQAERWDQKDIADYLRITPMTGQCLVCAAPIKKQARRCVSCHAARRRENPS